MAVALAQTVKHEDHAGSDSTPTTASFTTSAGSLLVCVIGIYDPGAGNPTVDTVQLDATTSGTQDITRQASSTDSRIYVFSWANVGAGSHTINCRKLGNGVESAAPDIIFYTLEITGAATSSPQDGAGSSATATAANPASGNFTASVTDGAWVGAFINENGSNDTTIAAGSGWTMDTTNGRQTDTAGIISGVETRMNPGSAGAFNADFTAASANYAAVQFVYKAAAGAVNIATPVGSQPHTGRAPILGFGIGMPDVP